MLFWKTPVWYPHKIIYKGYIEEGEGQYPLPKAVDWVENLGSMTDKVQWAAYKGFVLSAAFALADIRLVQLNNIKSSTFTEKHFLPGS